MSKLVERVVAKQVQEHIHVQDLDNSHQCAYKTDNQMEGSYPESDEKPPVQDGVKNQISDGGEGDMFSSEYSLVSDSRAFTQTHQTEEQASPDPLSQTSQPIHTSMTQSAQEQVRTELLSQEQFDLPSIPAVEQQDNSMEPADSKDENRVAASEIVKEEDKLKDNRENGEDSFEVISKGDVDDIVHKPAENLEASAEHEVSASSTEPSSQPVSTQQEEENWMFVLGHQKLKKKVTKAGEGHFTRPVYSQVVTVRCRGKLENGTVIDACDDLQFTVGDGDVIQALDLCLPMMELNETSIIQTDPKYAYGDKGREPDVPAGAHIEYEVELKDIEDQPKYQSLPLSHRIETGSKKRERGNWWYSRTDYSSAINSYNKALTILDEQCGINDSPEDVKSLQEERVKCHNNLGAAQLKVEAWQAAIKSCDAVLKHQPHNVKALFRKGKCLAGKGDIEAAITVLRESLKIEPESKLIHNELSRLVNKQKLQTQSTREMYQRMMGTDRAQADQEEQASAWKWYAGGAALAALASAGIAAYKYM